MSGARTRTRKTTLLRQLAKDALELTRAVELTVSRKEPPAAMPARRVAREVVANDSFRVLTLVRLREAARRWHVPGAGHVLRMAMTIVFSIEIDQNVELGDGVYFAHTLGTVIGGDARIGPRVRFMGNNTVGTAKENGYPVIEADVLVGAGARILGPVHVGKGAVIGANAVVLHDVPAGAVVTGIPARVHRPREEPPS